MSSAIRTALISVSDKTGVVDLAKGLRSLGVKIISSGGTAEVLRKENVDVQDVSSITGYPEMMDGRVKTVHPTIFGGILFRRGNPQDQKEVQKNKIAQIDLVVVNVYPFEQTLLKKNVSEEECIENIDIGGPSLLRAAAKNFHDVTVVVDPNDYPKLLEEMKANQCSTTHESRKLFASKVFMHTARYDALIDQFFRQKLTSSYPQFLNLSFSKVEDLRYGENPHQSAALYKELTKKETSVCFSQKIHGKQLSYNNILDINEALELVKDFVQPTVAIIKHTNPSGVASAETIEEAFKNAYEADPMAAFGGIIALNRPCSKKIAEVVHTIFVEVIIAPSFDEDAKHIVMQKPNIRLIETGTMAKSEEGMLLRSVTGGMLTQSRNWPEILSSSCKVVTKRAPSQEEMKDLLFAWRVNKHVKSNGIVFAKNLTSVGVGAGQMSRVDAVKIAREKSKGASKGAVMSSDAFFPFRDGIDEAIKGGITAIIQPGGSLRDKESIQAADENNVAMVFTGIRLFKH